MSAGHRVGTQIEVTDSIVHEWKARTRSWRFLGPVTVFLLAFGVFLPPSLLGVTVFDEGFIVTGAMQVLHGKLPYRDFLSMYGPGQYFLTAGLFAVFGEQLVVAHVAHAALLAGLAVTVFELAKVASANQRSIPTIVVLSFAGVALYAQPNVGYPAISAALALLWAAFMFGKWDLNQRRWTLSLASVLVGVAAVFRWDFGLYGLVALAVTAAVLVISRPSPSSRLMDAALCVAGPALTIVAAVYVPMVFILSDPARWFNEALLYSILEFPKWRNLQYLRPLYWDFANSLRDGNQILLSTSVLRLSYVVLPIGLAVATLGIAGLRLVRQRPYKPDRATAQSLLLGVLSLLLLNQMRVRPYLWQGFPFVIASLPLLPYVLGVLQVRSRTVVAVRTLPWVGAFVVGAFLFQAALSNWMPAVSSRSISLNVPRAAGVRVDRDMAYYVDLVDYIRTRTVDGEAIYSGAVDHSRVLINDCMLYFLADRPPADRFTEMEPGLSNTRSSQREIVESLKEKSVRVVVLFAIGNTEPNLSAASNGVRDLDEFLAERYRPTRTFGPYTVLEPK
jgi:hypothetical protein